MRSQCTDFSMVNLETIKAARERISSAIIHTPLVISDRLGDETGTLVYLKLENLQRIGAFKVRGALNKITTLNDEERRRGVICASSGNHGLGVAYASARFGAHCTVVLPENVNPHKLSLLSKLGANVVTYGITSDVRQQKVDELSRDYGFTQVHPFADPVLISGQGTIGLEIIEDLADVEEVYVPIGGGGLISGVAVAVKELRPGVKVYGVEPEHSNALSAALSHGGPVALSSVETIADGLAARITEAINYTIVRHYVDEIILVKDQDILDATFFLLDRAKVLAEPSGAASFAGLLANQQKRGKSVVVISGGNVTFSQLEELTRAGRVS
ncbi:MAG: hypothetical protein DMG06_07065 [Acidobacteria bacterium]|nr:MAG: hypothetical protein DMG06_07065 [Acidobacteriota bacterium]